MTWAPLVVCTRVTGIQALCHLLSNLSVILSVSGVGKQMCSALIPNIHKHNSRLNKMCAALSKNCGRQGCVCLKGCLYVYRQKVSQSKLKWGKMHIDLWPWLWMNRIHWEWQLHNILYYKMGIQPIKMICLIVVPCLPIRMRETLLNSAVNPTTIFCKMWTW